MTFWAFIENLGFFRSQFWALCELDKNCINGNVGRTDMQVQATKKADGSFEPKKAIKSHIDP